MSLVRVTKAVPLDGQRLRLTLTDGRTLERDAGPLLVGPVFDPIRNDPALFRQVRVEHGTVVWPGGVDLCPDVLIWERAAARRVIPSGQRRESPSRPRLDFRRWKADRYNIPRRTTMKTTAENIGMDPALKTEMQEACDRIAKGILPTMEERKAAAAKIDQMRVENAKLFGIQDITLEAVRESRHSQ